MPLNKNVPPPRTETLGGKVTRIIHPDGKADEIAVSDDGNFKLTKHDGANGIAGFSSRETSASAPGTNLKTNSDESARKLAASLKPVLDELAAERDSPGKQGRKNLALNAKVTASAFRDQRFSPVKAIDNLTAEYPIDGHLDYTQGILWTSGRFAGYGPGKDSNPAAAAALRFEHRVIDPSGPKDPWVKIVGDLNGDKLPDVITGGQKGPVVWYCAPDWKKTEIASGGYQTVDGEVGDVDGDGDWDVIVGAEYWYENPRPKGDAAQGPWMAHRFSSLRTHDIEVADLDVITGSRWRENTRKIEKRRAGTAPLP